MSSVKRTAEALIPGQQLTREEFLRRWEGIPELKRAELIVRFRDGRSLQVVAAMKQLHNSELFDDMLRRTGDESPRYEVGYQSVGKRRNLEAFVPGHWSKHLKKF